jgi:hypothetical protein
MSHLILDAGYWMLDTCSSLRAPEGGEAIYKELGAWRLAYRYCVFALLRYCVCAGCGVRHLTKDERRPTIRETQPIDEYRNDKY